MFIFLLQGGAPTQWTQFDTWTTHAVYLLSKQHNLSTDTVKDLLFLIHEP